MATVSELIYSDMIRIRETKPLFSLNPLELHIEGSSVLKGLFDAILNLQKTAWGPFLSI